MGCLWWCHLMLGAVAFLTEDCSGTLSSSSSSSHSLRYLYTVLGEFDQEHPEVTVLAYVDDQLISRYDSNTGRIQPQVAWMSRVAAEDPQHWEKEIQRIQSWGLELRQVLNNITRFIKDARTVQYMEGCEVFSNGNKEGYAKTAYNGQDFLVFDQQYMDWRAGDFLGRALGMLWPRKRNLRQKLKSYLEEECIEQLRKYLEIGTEALLRKESPVVKATRWVGDNDLQILVCQVYGFYPKEIDISWRKDGEVWEQDHFPEAVAPNSDGTYHARLSVQINPKDRDHYQCHVEHASFQDPLDVAWEDSERHPRNHSTFKQKELASTVATSLCTERTQDVISAVLNLKDTVEKAMRCFEKRLSDLENTVENLKSQRKNE